MATVFTGRASRGFCRITGADSVWITARHVQRRQRLYHCSSADLWVGFPGTQSVDQPRSIPEKVENQLRINTDVIDVKRIPGRWLTGNGRPAVAFPPP